jgi:hypothetical protein
MSRQKIVLLATEDEPKRTQTTRNGTRVVVVAADRDREHPDVVPVDCASVCGLRLSLRAADLEIERARNRVRPVSLAGRLGASEAIAEACVLDSPVRALRGSEERHGDRVDVEMASRAIGAAIVLVSGTQSIGPRAAPA